jgi:hypothetical protein
MTRYHIPLIEPDVQISRIRPSDKASRYVTGTPMTHPNREAPLASSAWRPSEICYTRESSWTLSSATV